MAIRVYKKTSAGRRFASVNLHVEVTKKSPEKSLLGPLPKKGGRNNSGKITVRGRGGGAKRQYRKIDFKRRDRAGVVGKVIGVEYDPNRSAHIALIQYADGIKRYIISPIGLTVGAEVMTSVDVPIDPNPGNAMPLKFIPLGLEVHCIEMQPGRGAQICRSAGCAAKLSNKEGEYATLVMPSGEIRRVHVNCLATIGQVGNIDHQNRRLGKAGITRHMGRRPITRGVAKSHHAHPLGGGSGRSKGNRPPCGPTGVESKGGRTRNRKKHSTQLIIRRRRSVRYGQLK